MRLLGSSGQLLARAPLNRSLLARALRRIARPISYFDLAQKFGVSESSAHKSVNCRFVKWIIATYIKAQLIDRWPRTPQKCAEMAGAFTLSHSHISAGKNVIRGCIGALDGTLVPIWCKDFLQKLYYCRKGACVALFRQPAPCRLQPHNVLCPFTRRLLCAQFSVCS